MEADLDSLLDSHFSDTDDDSNSIVPHRTIDEILNDSDVSTSSSSPSSPLSNHHSSDNRLARSNTVPQEFVQSLKESDALSEGQAESSKLSSFKRIGVPIWWVSSTSSSKQLPTLFGGVKSNAKPGAALAAAAAASRSVHRHMRLLSSQEGSKSSVSGEKLEIDEYNNDNKMGDFFQSADAHEGGEDSVNNNGECETEKVIRQTDAVLGFDKSLNKEATVFGSDEVLDNKIDPDSMISQKAENNSRSTMKPLELAEELEKKQASTGLHWEEGAAAQPMRLEGVKRGSTTLGYFYVEANNTITRTLSSQAFRSDHGSPQVLAVHLKFIAVGMTKGVIILVSRKYSTHHSDSMDSKMVILGLHGDRSLAPVTSMCFKQPGDLLLVGYGDGHVTVWDVQRASATKVISGEHNAPVIHCFWGRIHKLLASLKLLQCLLDGQRTSTVLSASPLLFDGGSSLAEGVVIFVTYQSALVVRLTPTLEVCAQLSRPDGVREGSMPYTAWTCMVHPSGSSSENTPTETPERSSLLALAWDRKVQVAKLVKSDLKVYGSWSLDSSAIALAWLDDQMMVVLTMSGKLNMFSGDGTLIHQTSFAIDGLGGDDLITYHTHFFNIFGNPEKAYHNCVTVLWKAGDWMGALNMAMTLYDGQAHGVIDLPRNLDSVQETIMPYLPDDWESRNGSVHSGIKEQFTHVGGVAVEFCVHIRRTDILSDEIFSKFVAVLQRDAFLELLEPYILKDMLGCLPPEIMQALVEHYSSKGWFQRVEQCVLHMDISSLDFNQVVILCGCTVCMMLWMLVYLKYCFKGLAFPPGQGTLPPSRMLSLRTELLQFLLELDTEATLDVLKCAFTEEKSPELDSSFSESGDANVEAKKGKDLMADSETVLVQKTIDALVHVLDKNAPRTDGSASDDDIKSIEAWPSEKDKGYLFEFVACYVACGRAKIPKTVLNQILEYLTSENNSSQSVSTMSTESSKRREAITGTFGALDSYVKDVEEPIYAFAFINNMLMQLSNGDYTTFRLAVISRIPELINLSREETFLLVVDHFNGESSLILSELKSHPKCLFLHLKTVIEVRLSGTLNLSYLREEKIVNVLSGKGGKVSEKVVETYLEKMSNFPKFLRNNPPLVTDDMIELYRVEYCLRLCQEHGIIDAAVFLLERVGDVGSALLLTLSSLNDKFADLDTAIGSMVSKVSIGRSGSMEYFNSVLKMEEVNDIRTLLQACIKLCQRNTPRLNPEESEMLWFRLLDSFCEPLMGSYCNERVVKKENHVRLVESLGSKDEEECIIKWRIPKSHKGGHILRKLLSQFIKDIVEGMIGYVHLPTIMSKLLSDNGGQEFGDFKLTILGMLGTYGFERRILDTAKSLIEDDTFYTMSLLKKGASHGYAPRNLLCCICNSLLTKNSSSLRVPVFSCGHATHLQ
ncbi:vacuolar protein sorting-associated protein 8-like protein isoform X3 [Hibiscus syriacus]|uniref:Vacuolar protein sorting-associated protein 8-like protein isoform X3 n=1 Tax=Hibiscus syriacus TaxID=106335 RepID=A0A6A2YA90_HIBSY|nr:vacuolar protein sorting-associated protein 8-like protein isoform X3 [Hibiscus syriacus]